MKQISPLLTVVCAILLFGSGCENPFAPKLGDVTGENLAILTDRRSPEEVLENFRYAYIYRDSLVYSELIDTSFIFIYFDPNLEGAGRFDSWGRDVELRSTAGLFRAVSNISVEWNSTVEEKYWTTGVDSISHEGFFPGAEKASLSKSFTLKLGTEVLIAGTAEFNFGREGSAMAWRITRWRDESIF